MTERPERSGATFSRFVDTAFGRMHVRETDGDGPPILALHGFPDDSRIFDRLTRYFSTRRFLALDFGGFGHSGRVEYTDLPDRRREDEIGAVLDAVGLDQVTLIGHDASGAVA